MVQNVVKSAYFEDPSSLDQPLCHTQETYSFIKNDSNCSYKDIQNRDRSPVC